MTQSRYHLRLMETFRSVFYTPIYVSVGGGFLNSAGLDVEFDTCPSQFPHPLSALNHGAADIVQSGIMRSIISADWGAETVPAHFAKINSRDGFFLLSRKPAEEFRWENLPGSTLIPVGFSPMPWASLQAALRKHGVEPEQLNLLTGLSLEQSMEAFRSGQADYIHLPEPAVEELLADGTGHLAVALGKENGHIAYSSFAATNKFLDGNQELVARFAQGFANALAWLASNDAKEVAVAVALFFSQLPKELIEQAIARYKEQETWPEEPTLAEPEYLGLQEILVGAGLVKERQPYEKVVRSEFVAGLSR